MAMSRDAALIRCGKVYRVLRRELFDAGKIEIEDIELNLSWTFEGLDISDKQKQAIYVHMRNVFGSLPPLKDVNTADFVTLRDMRTFVYQYYQNHLSFDAIGELWKYLSRKLVKYSHPDKTQYKLSFTPEEIRWDTLILPTLGVGQMDIEKLRKEMKETFYGETLPPIDIEGTFLAFLQDTYNAMFGGELSVFTLALLDVNEAEPAYEPPIGYNKRPEYTKKGFFSKIFR